MLSKHVVCQQFTILVAAILVVVVGIVAIFDTGLDETIATFRHQTGCEATVLIAGVAIIAIFFVNPQDTVTATGFHAVGETVIAVVGIAIIALFWRFGIESYDAIAATCQLTGIGAGVLIVFIAIIAVLTIALFPVAAKADEALIRTAVTAPVVAVITGFNALPNDPVTTASGSTIFGTGIGRILVAIVTPLVTYIIRRKVPPEHAITTTSSLTGVGAGIHGVAIAIVAAFNALPQHTVATASHSAVASAGIIVGFVTVIASLKAGFIAS
tara:strand:+ start:240 stop:1049 length:810 start_codon:yes stop_codon:yes gene_type:complete